MAQQLWFVFLNREGVEHGRISVSQFGVDARDFEWLCREALLVQAADDRKIWSCQVVSDQGAIAQWSLARELSGEAAA